MAKGITIKVESGNQKIEITIGSDVTPEQLKVIQKVLQTLAEKSDNSKLKRKQRKHSVKKRGSQSKFFKVKMIVLERLSNGQWFTSLDLRELYEEIYQELLPANSASTYLRRMEDMGLLESKKDGKIVEYRVISSPLVQKNFHDF